MTTNSPYILYGGGVTRAAGPQMVLEEAALPYELRKVDPKRGEHRSADFLALNPAGFVPALVTPEGETWHEAAAIMLALADRHGLEELAPRPDAPDRALFYCKLFYQTNDLQPLSKMVFYPERFSTSAADAPRIRESAQAAALERWRVLDDFLQAQGPFHLGERFSLVDIHMAMWAAYGLNTPSDILDACPSVARCFSLVAARPKCGPILLGLQSEITRWHASGGSVEVSA